MDGKLFLYSSFTPPEYHLPPRSPLTSNASLLGRLLKVATIWHYSLVVQPTLAHQTRLSIRLLKVKTVKPSLPKEKPFSSAAILPVSPKIWSSIPEYRWRSTSTNTALPLPQVTLYLSVILILVVRTVRFFMTVSQKSRKATTLQLLETVLSQAKIMAFTL